MAIYIDPPLWPAHGTVWSHLISDESLEELHRFALRLKVPRRGFDLDHYDVPASLYDRALTLGALPLGSKELVYVLRDSGFRIPQKHRNAARPIERQNFLRSEWIQLADAIAIENTDHTLEQWRQLGDDLISRWNEPHRSYHDEQHLEDVLLSLNQLAIRGEVIAPTTLVAAWFHDAIYTGSAGNDEMESANLAATSLESFDAKPSTVALIHELIVATDPSSTRQSTHDPHLFDADLAIFGAGNARYLRYTASVRQEYRQVPEDQFRQGRAKILQNYLEQPMIYRSSQAQFLWEELARLNLATEISELLG